MNVVTVDRDGRRLAVWTTATIETFTFRLNAPGACRFTVPSRPQPTFDGLQTSADGTYDDTYDDTYLAGVRTLVEGARWLRDIADPDQGHEVQVVDGNRVVWEGPLVSVDETEPTVTFGAEGLMWYLRKMHVTTSLETAGVASPIPGATIIDGDQNLLVKALVDHGQSKPGGDRRIDTSAVTSSGTVRVEQYKGWEAPNVYEQVQSLTARTTKQGGVDVAVRPGSRQLACWTPRRGRRRNNLIFNDRNVRRWGRRLDKTDQETAVIGVGAGQGRDTLQIVRTSATDVGRVGRLEGVEPRKSVTRQQTLIDHADARLVGRSTLPDLISVEVAIDEPAVFSYEVGDEARIHYPSRYEPVDVWRRIVGIDVTPAQDGREGRATLHLQTIGTS